MESLLTEGVSVKEEIEVIMFVLFIGSHNVKLISFRVIVTITIIFIIYFASILSMWFSQSYFFTFINEQDFGFFERSWFFSVIQGSCLLKGLSIFVIWWFLAVFFTWFFYLFIIILHWILCIFLHLIKFCFEFSLVFF